MSKITVCDICGERNNVNSRYYPYDRRADGAGGMEDVGDDFDLCLKHEVFVLKRVIKSLTDQKESLSEYQIGSRTISIIRALISKRKGLKSE